MAESLDDKLARAFANIEVKLDAINNRIAAHQAMTEDTNRLLGEIRITVNALKSRKT